MVAKIPFDDPVLRDLCVLDHAPRVNLTYEPIVRMGARFAPNLDAEQLKNEYEQRVGSHCTLWYDFQLLGDGNIVLEEDGQAQ